LQKFHARKVVVQILAQLPKEPMKNEFEGIAAFQSILEYHRQIIFNLLDAVVKRFSLELKDFKDASALVESATQIDEMRHDGFAPIASQVLHLSILLIAIRMQQAHAQRKLGAQQIKDLLYGAIGEELILREVIQHFLTPSKDEGSALTLGPMSRA
jgi:hypothetical protein